MRKKLICLTFLIGILQLSNGSIITNSTNNIVEVSYNYFSSINGKIDVSERRVVLTPNERANITFLNAYGTPKEKGIHYLKGCGYVPHKDTLPNDNPTNKDRLGSSKKVPIIISVKILKTPSLKSLLRAETSRKGPRQLIESSTIELNDTSSNAFKNTRNTAIQILKLLKNGRDVRDITIIQGKQSKEKNYRMISGNFLSSSVQIEI